MKIESRTAREIVQKLSETIGHKINIMDTDGVIIASSDPAREGKIHGGALKLIRENLSSVIVESNDQFAGSKNGVNLPVVINNEVVGVIGITGSVSKVLKYGEIIKHMTEILLLEERAKDLSTIEQKAKDRFFNEWVVERLEENSPERFKDLAEDLAVDISASYRVVAISLSGELHLGSDTLTEISRYIRRTLRREVNGSAFRTASHMVCLIPDADTEKLNRVLNDILSAVQSGYNCRLKAGVADCDAVLHLTDAHSKALQALERATAEDLPSPVTYYDPYDINFLLRSLAPSAKENYMRSLFRDTDPAQIGSYLDFAAIYLEENGALEHIAERLYIHKNTVKYKIHKLTELTGVDIRTCNGAYVFTVACMLGRGPLTFPDRSVPGRRNAFLV